MLHLIKNKLFIRLIGAFIITGIVGILIQLTAFYPMAKYLSFQNTSISYNSIGLCKGGEVDTFFNNTYEKYSHEIEQNLPFPNKEKFTIIYEKIRKESLSIELMVPSIIILIGNLGFMYLFNDYKKRKVNNSFTFKQWVATFATFFWARNLAIDVLYGISIVLNNENYFLLMKQILHHL